MTIFVSWRWELNFSIHPERSFKLSLRMSFFVICSNNIVILIAVQRRPNRLYSHGFSHHNEIEWLLWSPYHNPNQNEYINKNRIGIDICIHIIHHFDMKRSTISSINLLCVGVCSEIWKGMKLAKLQFKNHKMNFDIEQSNHTLT